MMKRLSSLMIVAALIAAPAANADSSANVPAAALKFYRTKEGLTFANAWGDPMAGAHSNYILMEGQTRSPVHTHSADYYGVVITGVVANAPPGTPDQPLPAGSFWYQRSKEPHVTACVSTSTCLIFVTSPGSFDFLPAL